MRGRLVARACSGTDGHRVLLQDAVAPFEGASSVCLATGTRVRLVRMTASTKEPELAAGAEAAARVPRKERAVVLISSSSKSALTAAIAAISSLLESLGRKCSDKSDRAAGTAAAASTAPPAPLPNIAAPRPALTGHLKEEEPARAAAQTAAPRVPEAAAAAAGKSSDGESPSAAASPSVATVAPAPTPRTALQMGRPRSHRGTAAPVEAASRELVPSLNLPLLDMAFPHPPDDRDLALLVPPPPPTELYSCEGASTMTPRESAAQRLGARKARAAPVDGGFQARSALGPTITPRPTGSWTPRYSQATMEIVA